ncbi:hypothetical protein TCDM_12892 [Trypanosoma cruzi Dm28c]|uniref:Uncharacterized protein n=1 Tax=Trypanosoma cruzi Dm28c TaxID=1416333 RepID=V5APS2_TRYCR|nr:hypothetical protein TCDM_12892 [Trypanosoma cruzi Dm28c]
MRAAGEAHRAVVVSVSVVCEWSSWAETHGTPHRKSAEETIKKKKTFILAAPRQQAKKEEKNGNIRKKNCGE